MLFILYFSCLSNLYLNIESIDVNLQFVFCLELGITYFSQSIPSSQCQNQPKPPWFKGVRSLKRSIEVAFIDFVGTTRKSLDFFYLSTIAKIIKLLDCFEKQMYVISVKHKDSI